MDASNKTMMKPYNLIFAIRSKRVRNSIKLANPMSGIYIHIPFCKQACNYCDFHFSTSMGRKEEMVLALAKEMQIRKPELANDIIETIYFGGGTPSILSSEQIDFLIIAVYENFKVVE